MIAPAVSRRAFRLAEARARLQAPLSESQARAERDALRGQHAIDIVRLEKRLAASEEDRALRQAALGRLAGRLADIEGGARERAAEIERQRQELAALSAERTELQAQLGSLEMGMRDLTGQRDRVQDLLEMVREHALGLESQLDESRAAIAVLETRATGAQVELEQVRRESASAVKAATASQKTHADELAARSEQAARLSRELDEARRKLAHAEQTLAEMTDKVHALEGRHFDGATLREEAIVENSRLLKRLAEREGQLADAKAALEEAQSRAEAVARGDQTLRMAIARLGRDILRGAEPRDEAAPAPAQVVSFSRRDPPPIPGANDTAPPVEQPQAASEG